ncbi:MAG: glycosyltransferase family 2 protein [Planctomycetota bacterium]
MNQVPLSVVVLSKNEEHNLPRCLDSLQWADEVVVIDDESVDRSVEISLEHGARVLNHPFVSFAAQRNWALNEADLRNEWVLMLDADEVATEPFASEIASKIETASAECVAFRTCRKTMMDDKWLRYSDGFPVWIMRLVRRGAAEFEDSGHGEVPVPVVNGEIDTIREPFVHYPFSRGMEDWWKRHVSYAGREAKREVRSAGGESLVGLCSWNASRRRRAARHLSTLMPARGTLRFIYQYVLKRGFLDGRAGYRFCRMMACYESMITIRKME